MGLLAIRKKRKSPQGRLWHAYGDPSHPDWFTGGGATRQFEKKKKKEQRKPKDNGDPSHPDWFTGGGATRQFEKENKKKQRKPKDNDTIVYPSASYTEVMKKKKLEGKGTEGTTSDYRKQQVALADEDHSREMDILLGLRREKKKLEVEGQDTDGSTSTSDYRKQQEAFAKEDHSREMDIVLGLR